MSNKTFRDRQILSAAQQTGGIATLGAYLRLSGPGWLQSAITLGGGSLAGALYLGMTGGYSLLWVQLVAMFCGIVMLSAISYVTLSTGKRPYVAMNEYVNPVLGVAWITATILANMIFILPQFSLAYDALQFSLLPDQVDGSDQSKYLVTGIIAAVATGIVLLSLKPGWMSKLFDLLLKLIVGAIVVCFVVAVVQLAIQGKISLEVLWGFLPDLHRLTEAAPKISDLLISESLDGASRTHWQDELVSFKQDKMIASAAAAVGINMTFLLPYSMLSRGWDKTFRGLARWDLITGMAIPFVVVTSCIVITAAYGFHAKADAELLSKDPAVVTTSGFYDTVEGQIEKKLSKDEAGKKQLAAMTEDEKKTFLAETIANLPEEERKLAVALAKPTTSQLAKSLEPLLGKERASLVFGIGVVAMAFSTIIILMLINGYAFGEILGDYENPVYRMIGSLLAVIVGVFWVSLWSGKSGTYLAIVAGTFAILLLPIAYFAFLLMMNNRELMGDEKPRGSRMGIWNLLMGLSLAIVSWAAYSALSKKIADPATGGMVFGGVVTFGILMLIGFSARFNNGKNRTSVQDQT